MLYLSTNLGGQKMLIQPDLIKKIKDFGLNSYEAKIWTALLSRGISSAGELSDISNVPRSRTYDVLESLEKKGFIMMKLGKPIKYMAIPPEEVIERVKKKIREESISQEKQMDDLKNSNVLTDLTTLHTQGIDTVEPTDLAGVLKNRNNLYNHIELTIKNAQSTVYIVTSEDGLSRKFDAMKKTLKKVAENGVKIKILTPLSKNAEKSLIDFKGIAEIKNTSMKGRFILVDGKEMIFMVTDDKDVHPSYDTGMWINSPYFVSLMKDIFETMWKK
jgi:sugar-specific transcriptional regulator TrmB